jgi:hypothetical protein
METRRPVTWPDGPAALVTEAQRAYQAFQAWAKQTRLVIEQSEISLISETHGFGGTLDAVLIADQRAMCDFKTSAQIYPAHLLQVAAYAHLWTENRPSEPILGGHYILRFSRGEYGDFAASHFGNLDDAWTAFLHCLELYKLRSKLKARCR